MLTTVRRGLRGAAADSREVATDRWAEAAAALATSEWLRS